jgi:hypothetical protein
MSEIVTQSLWHPSGMRFLSAIISGGVATAPLTPSSAVGTNGEKTFRGERFFIRVRFIGKRYCAGHVVPKMQQK